MNPLAPEAWSLKPEKAPGPGFLRTFEDFFCCRQDHRVLTHLSRDVGKVQLGGSSYFIKREHCVLWKERFASWCAGLGFVGKSVREWNVMQRLRALQIGCPVPVATGEQGHRAFLMTREVSGALGLDTYLRLGYCEDRQRRARLARSLGQMLGRFHEAGLVHRCLYAYHVLVRPCDQSLYFIDFQRTRVRRRISWYYRYLDLALLDRDVMLEEPSVSLRDRMAFFRGYLGTIGQQHSPRALRRRLWVLERFRNHFLRRKRREKALVLRALADWHIGLLSLALRAKRRCSHVTGSGGTIPSD